MKSKQINIRITEDEKEELEKIAFQETIRTGYEITVSALLTKITRQYINNYIPSGVVEIDNSKKKRS